MNEHDKELQQLKERLEKLEYKVERMQSGNRPSHSIWSTAIRTFLIVFIIMLIANGLFSFFRN
ncbi:hypothetical protein ACFQZE_07885 [Paenibacillus sp. GCM10027627]|uniref:hypothetical protein n=1 Tax=unclassified Paenibacillus TaxID=185978 RepID=UPI003645B7FB